MFNPLKDAVHEDEAVVSHATRERAMQALWEELDLAQAEIESQIRQTNPNSSDYIVARRRLGD